MPPDEPPSSTNDSDSEFAQPQGRSAGAIVVALLAIVAVFAIVGVKAGEVTATVPLSPSNVGVAFWYMLLPFLIVITLVATGFPRLGDLAAVVVACWIGAWAAILAMLTFDRGIIQVVLLQLVMLIVALWDLWHTRNRPLVSVPVLHRMIGLLVPVVVGLAGYFMLAAPVKRESERRAQLTPSERSLEVGYPVDQPPPRTDTIIIASDEWTDRDARMPLMGLARCIEIFRGKDGGPYPASLRELHRWSLTRGPYEGCASKLAWNRGDSTHVYLSSSDAHLIRYAPPPGPADPYRPGPFTLESEAIWDSVRFPRAAGRVGLRNYLLDARGKLHVATGHRRATVRDKTLPDCDETHFTEVAECGVVYPPRRRWGALRLPFASLSMTTSVQVGETFTPMLTFMPVNGLDSIARVTIQWNDSTGAVAEDVPLESTKRYGARYGENDWNRFAPHAYNTPGRREVILVVATRSGELYEARQWIVVEPKQ
jgi:hypothetical protein